MRYHQAILFLHANTVASERTLTPSRHSQLIEQIKQMFTADVVKKGFYQLNHSNQL
jgi:hypothetical protein